MRIQRLHPEIPGDYCCNLYWVLGDGTDPRDLNTLVDAGSSHPDTLAALLEQMQSGSKGIGRRAVEQVVITHWHYDHVGGLPALVAAFQPLVWAFRAEPGVGRQFYDGCWLRMGDRDFRAIHTPGHSEDSVCLFCPETRELFSGDTLYRISDRGGAYPECYVRSLQRLRTLAPKTILPGHGEAIEVGVAAFIDEVLGHVSASVLHQG